MPDKREWLTVAEVCELLERQPQSVRRSLERGTLQGIKTSSGIWLVSRDSVAAYIDNPPLPGPKPKDEEE